MMSSLANLRTDAMMEIAGAANYFLVLLVMLICCQAPGILKDVRRAPTHLKHQG
jgi:hypothetical protein